MSDALPSIAAILLLLANPVLTARAKRQVQSWIDKSMPYALVNTTRGAGSERVISRQIVDLVGLADSDG